MANDWNEKIIEEFRSNNGRVGGQFEGAPLLLLTTKGAKTGREHTAPMMYLDKGDRLMVFASKAGADTDPDWYRNLVANPTVTVEVGTDKFTAEAAALEGDERAEVYAEQSAAYPTFAEYAQKTTRRIPVVALKRA